jgi:hypothetical protein
VVLLDGRTARAAGAGIESAEENAALRDGVDLSIARDQRSLQQHAALERLRVGERGHGDVEPRALLGEGRDVRGDHDDRHVLVGDVGRRDDDAELARHVGDGLLRELLVGIALAVEAGDDAVADQLIVARAADRRHVLDARLRLGEDGQDHQRDDNQQRVGDETVRLEAVEAGVRTG